MIIWKRGQILWAAPQSDESIHQAKEYCKNEGLSRHEVSIVAINGQILVEVREDVERHELGD